MIRTKIGLIRVLLTPPPLPHKPWDEEFNFIHFYLTLFN